MGGAQLARRLGTADAVTVGLTAMLGAGVFSAFAPAARASGGAVLPALLLAALVAVCNATSSAQLAAQYPSSGGTYLYGRERLGPWWGFLAGWSFVVGKTASCAAMALTVAAYAVPPAAQRPVAAAVVVLLVAVGHRGVTRTAHVGRLLVALVLLALGALVVAAAADGRLATGPLVGTDDGAGALGVVQAAGLLFFAFAGYARLATLGEEVRDPARTIPRAVLLALGAVLLVYAAVGAALLGTLGPAGLAASAAPLLDAADVTGTPALRPLLRAAAVAAAAGALLALLAGVSRTALAMARGGDLPAPLAAVHPRHGVPHVAELAVGAAVLVLVLVTDLRGAVGASSFGVLLYYAVANAAALTQTGAHRRYPRALQVLGLLGCLGLAAALPLRSALVAAAVLAVGAAGRALLATAATGRGH